MQIVWWNCVNYGVPSGTIRDVTNSDPSPWVYLKNNYTNPTYLKFCLAMRNASGGADSFEGELSWDGNS